MNHNTTRLEQAPDKTIDAEIVIVVVVVSSLNGKGQASQRPNNMLD